MRRNKGRKNRAFMGKSRTAGRERVVTCGRGICRPSILLPPSATLSYHKKVTNLAKGRLDHDPRGRHINELGRVCKTIVWARCWYETRRFDRQAMGTFGATPTTQKAQKRSSERGSSPHPKR